MTERKTKTGKEALRLRQRIKRGKPNFVRPESWRYVRIKPSWRRPRGLDHKVRIEYAGWPPGVSIGYRGPKGTRGLHPSGYEEVLVYNPEELRNIDAKTQVARIAHTVGRRKRAMIFAEAKKKKIVILNTKESKEVAAEEGTIEKNLEETKKEKEAEEMEKPKKKEDKGRKRKKEKEEQ